jgi:hypothetical protein
MDTSEKRGWKAYLGYDTDLVVWDGKRHGKSGSVGFGVSLIGGDGQDNQGLGSQTSGALTVKSTVESARYAERTTVSSVMGTGSEFSRNMRNLVSSWNVLSPDLQKKWIAGTTQGGQSSGGGSGGGGGGGGSVSVTKKDQQGNTYTITYGPGTYKKRKGR